jgi:hypothetical protein
MAIKTISKIIIKRSRSCLPRKVERSHRGKNQTIAIHKNFLKYQLSIRLLTSAFILSVRRKMRFLTILILMSCSCWATTAATSESQQPDTEDQEEGECANANVDDIQQQQQQPQYSAEEEAILDEKVWQKGTWWDMHDWLECAQITDDSKYVIHDGSTWKSYRRAYEKAFEDAKDEFPDEIPTYFPEDGTDDMPVPYISKYTEGMGRGNFAAAFIPKGTLVWKSIHVGEFRHPTLYRRFLRQLIITPDTTVACEMLHFTYTGQIDHDDEDSPYVICVEMSPSSYNNMCNTPAECNIDFLEPSKGLTDGCKGELYATRDILKGEEFMMPYDAIDEGLEEVGLRGPPCCNKEDEELETSVWETGNWRDMYEWLECSHISDEDDFMNSIHDESTWNFYRDTYQTIIMEDGETDFLAMAPKFPDDGGTDFKVPVTPRYTEEEGHGMFANAFIPKGTLVWKSAYVAEFPHATLYRRFLRQLQEKEDAMACEVLHWTYSSPRRRVLDDDHEEISYAICVELSPSAYTNACSEGAECNVGYLEAGDNDHDDTSRQGCNHAVYATRDIQKGEEILVPYGVNEKWYDSGGLGLDGPSCFNED